MATLVRLMSESAVENPSQVQDYFARSEIVRGASNHAWCASVARCGHSVCTPYGEDDVMKNVKIIATWSALLFGLIFLAPGDALAHCDSLDGPVVKAAQRALETRDLSQVLIWVQAADELEIRAAFEQTLAVRVLSPQGQALADRYFFETVVRVHRVGEGASYTGLKPAGRDLGPAIPAADKALGEGSPSAVITLLTKSLEERLRKQFDEVLTAKQFKPGDVIAGREYVRTYVEFIHFVERLYEAIMTPAHGHIAGSAPAAARR